MESERADPTGSGRIRWACGHKTLAREWADFTAAWPRLAGVPVVVAEIPGIACQVCLQLPALFHRALVAWAVCPDCGPWRTGADAGGPREERR